MIGGSWLGGLASLGRSLPGFAEGDMAAHDFNWRMRKNYQNDLNDQIQNAYRLATFGPNVGLKQLDYENGLLDYDRAAMDGAVAKMMFPARMDMANAASEWSPTLAQLMYLNQFMGGILPYGQLAMGMSGNGNFQFPQIGGGLPSSMRRS